MVSFRNLKIAQAFAFLLIPLILYWVSGCVLLSSISAYANKSPLVFAFCLTLAGALFVYDGYLERNRWSNIYTGLALFGVVLFSYTDYPITHYIFAGVFFLGSLFNMVYFSSNRERFIKLLTAAAVLFGMAGCFVFSWYSIYWAEWLGMVPISLHFTLENLGKID